MKGNMKKLLLVLLLVVCIAISVFMFIDEEYAIAGFCILFALIIAFLLHRSIILNRSPESLFKGTISDILKTYDAILVEVENLPDISDKKLIQTITFKDMVNAEYEFRKPIYYIHNDYAYDFILFNKDDAYVYTVKVGNDKMSIVENYLAEKIKERSSSSSDLEMLDSLENTTVIKLNDDKEYLVSPVRKDEPKQDVIVSNNDSNIDLVNNVSTIDNNSSDIVINDTMNTPVEESNISDAVVEEKPTIENGINSEDNSVETTNVFDTVVQDNDTSDSNISSVENALANPNIPDAVVEEKPAIENGINSEDNSVETSSVPDAVVEEIPTIEDTNVAENVVNNDMNLQNSALEDVSVSNVNDDVNNNV